MEELIYATPEMQKRADEFIEWWTHTVKGPNLTKSQYELILERMKFPEDES